MFVNFVGVSIAVALLWKIGQRTSDWLTYAHLFSLLWGANLLISQIVIDGILKPETLTLGILYGAWWAFLAGTLFVIKKPFIKKQPIVRINRISAVTILMILVALQLIAYLYEIASIGIDPISYFRNFFIAGSEFRLSSIYSNISYPISMTIWRGDHVLYIPLALFLCYRKIISYKILGVVFVLSFILSWGKFTRAPFIQLVVIGFIAWVIIYKPRTKMRNIFGLTLAAIMLLSFVVTQYSLTEKNIPISRIVLTESLVGYIGASPMAYETLINGHFPRAETGYYSLEPINYVLFKLALIDDYPGMVRPYAAMPFVTNVYTFLDAFTLDWGVFLALVGSFLTGAAVAWVYNKIRFSPNYANITIYCFLVYCCIMAIATNEFIRIAVPIYIFLALIINTLITSRHENAH